MYTEQIFKTPGHTKNPNPSTPCDLCGRSLSEHSLVYSHCPKGEKPSTRTKRFKENILMPGFCENCQQPKLKHQGINSTVCPEEIHTVKPQISNAEFSKRLEESPQADMENRAVIITPPYVEAVTLARYFLDRWELTRKVRDFQKAQLVLEMLNEEVTR